MKSLFGKLKLIGKLFKRLQLLNSKYLLKRDDIYCISLKLSKNTTFKKSLHIDNFVYANVLKLKIIIKLRKMCPNLSYHSNVANKVKKNKKLTDGWLEKISIALIENHKLNEKIIVSLL